MAFSEIVLFLALMSGAGVVAGITSGLFGVGGGFVVVPALLAVFPFLTDQPDDLIPIPRSPGPPSTGVAIPNRSCCERTNVSKWSSTTGSSISRFRALAKQANRTIDSNS